MNQIATVLELTKENAVKLFEEEGIFAHIDHIRDRELSVVYDMSTKKGQDACRSAAAKIAKTKTAIDKLRKDHNEDHRNAIALVNAIGKDAVDQMQEIQDSIRKPLTDLEESEKKRVELIQNRIAVFKSFGESMDQNMVDYTIEQLKEREGQLQSIPVDESFDEYIEDANTAKTEALGRIEMFIFKLEKAQREYEEEQKRLAEEAEAARIEHEARIKAQAKIDAQREAEAAIQAEKDRADKAEQDRINQEAMQAEEARRAESKRLADIEQAKINEQNRIKAEQDEKNRIAEQERLAAEKKAANINHQKKINNSILAKLVDRGISEEIGKELIKSIAKNEIEYLQINY